MRNIIQSFSQGGLSHFKPSPALSSSRTNREPSLSKSTSILPPGLNLETASKRQGFKTPINHKNPSQDIFGSTQDGHRNSDGQGASNSSKPFLACSEIFDTPQSKDCITLPFGLPPQSHKIHSTTQNATPASNKTPEGPGSLQIKPNSKDKQTLANLLGQDGNSKSGEKSSLEKSGRGKNT